MFIGLANVDFAQLTSNQPIKDKKKMRDTTEKLRQNKTSKLKSS